MAATRLDLPTGTVTFLRTDVEGSMRQARALGSRWDELNDRQLGLIRSAVSAEAGIVVRTEGDAVFAAFPEAGSAVRAAVAIQRAIDGREWPPESPVHVRVGLHAGEAHLAGDDYGGFDVNRAARIAAVGHGGQIVMSEPVRALVAGNLPPGATVRDLGRHALRDVPEPERLHQLDVPGRPTEFPPLRTGTHATGNLPARLTTFLGRDRELAEVQELLQRARLVAIVGPGGIGKTSLAIEAARRAATATPDGAWFVPLDSTPEAALVGATVARTLGLFDGPGRPPFEGVRRWLADRTALLVLDNFEHVLDAAAELPALLQAAPGLRVLVTTRAPLRVQGEHEYPLGPLGGPGEDAAAVGLFEERARAVVPGWSAGEQSDLVAEICRYVDNLPLGIELAAARVGLLPLAAIRDRLAARLPLPGSGPRDVPSRQRTLEGAIGWSYDLLSRDHRALLRRLAVFDGGFDLERAADVAAIGAPGEDVLDGVVALADQSLVGRDGAASPAGSFRFGLLETIRVFGLKALREAGEEHDVRRRHAEAFAAFAESAASHLPGADQVRWLDRLVPDHANLRSAIRWATENGETRLAHRLAASTWRYFQLSGRVGEGRPLIDATLAMPGGEEPTRELVWAVGAAGSMAYWQGDTDRATELYTRQVELAQAVGDLAGEADGTWSLAATTWILEEIPTAHALIERAQALYQALGDEVGVARTAWGTANLLVEEGRIDEAIALIHLGRRRSLELNDVFYVGLAAGDLAFAYMLAGDLAEALRWAIEALRLAHALRDVASASLTLGAVGVIGFGALGRPREGMTLYAAFERLCEVHGIKPPAGFARMVGREDITAPLREGLTPELTREATEAGRRMELDEAVAYAIETAEALVGPQGLAVPDVDRE